MSTKEELLAKVVDIYDNNELGDRLALMADMMDLYPTNYEDSLDKKNLLDEMIKNMLSIDESYQNCFDLMKKDGDNKYLEQIADFVENGGNNFDTLEVKNFYDMRNAYIDKFYEETYYDFLNKLQDLGINKYTYPNTELAKEAQLNGDLSMLEHIKPEQFDNNFYVELFENYADKMPTLINKDGNEVDFTYYLNTKYLGDAYYEIFLNELEQSVANGIEGGTTLLQTIKFEDMMGNSSFLKDVVNALNTAYDADPQTIFNLMNDNILLCGQELKLEDIETCLKNDKGFQP